MLIKVKDKEGNIYTNDMSDSNKRAITEIHFCTSYTQFIVQDEIENEEGKIQYIEKDIIIPVTKNDLTTAIDMIAVSDDEIGELVN